MVERRSEADVLADWRAVHAEHAALDRRSAGWVERSAAVADRIADLMEEAADLLPMPAEVLQFVVGLAAYHEREHARRMLASMPTNTAPEPSP